MVRFSDRLYGALEFPDLVWQLATTCPVLLRLREIRMANIPFLTHPSFAHVDRYEHSLGVAHLAWRWSRRQNLSTDDALAVTLAGLYHDGATPAFGHLFEEYLRRFGFDHEKALVHLLQGTSEELPGAETAQVFLGRECKLRSILPRPASPNSNLTPLGIADIVAGKGVLGRMIKGRIDLDNIDNVVRACSAMGLVPRSELVHPYDVADALVLDAGEVVIDKAKACAISAWAEARRVLYEGILNNSYEFRSQATLKWAIAECAKLDRSLRNPGAWLITDPEMMFVKLRSSQFSRVLVDRLRLANPPDLLFSAWVQDLEPLTSERGGEIIAELSAALGELTNCEVYVNFYADKRVRQIDIPLRRVGLFDPELPAESALEISTSGGLIGAVYMSRVQWVSGQSESVQHKSLSKRPVALDDIIAVVTAYLRQPVVASSTRWLGTRPQCDAHSTPRIAV